MVAEQYQRRLEQQVRPARFAARLSYRRLIEERARKLRATIEGETRAYEPFRAR